MSRIPWVPPPPGGNPTKPTPKIRFAGIPPGAPEAETLYAALRGPIGKFYRKASKAAQTGELNYATDNRSSDGLTLRYMVTNGQEIVDIKVTPELIEEILRNPIPRRPWDWVLLEIHIPGDEILIPARCRALRIVPAPNEDDILHDGYVYDYDTDGRYLDGLTPPVMQYPPHPDDITPTLELEDGVQVSALLLDLRRFNASPGSALVAEVQGFVDGAPGDTYQRLSLYAHSAVDFIFPSTFIYSETTNTDTASGLAYWYWHSEPPNATAQTESYADYGEWIVDPGSIWPGNPLEQQVVDFVDPGQSDWTHTVNAEDAPLAPEGVVVTQDVDATWTANGSPSPNVGFVLNASNAGYWNRTFIYDPPSGLIKFSIGDFRKYRALSKPTNGGLLQGNTWTFLVEVQNQSSEFFPEPGYASETPTEPKEVDCVARITAGFGEPPLEPIKITDDGVPTDQYARMAVLDPDTENATILGTFVANNEVVMRGPQEDVNVWPFVGRLIINPDLYAATFTTTE